MRLPLFLVFAPIAALYGTVAFAADSWEWGIAAGVAWLCVFMLTEWVIDAVVREMRKIRLRG